MIHIVRVYMDGQNHFVIGDDYKAVERKVSELEARGGRVISRMDDLGKLGTVTAYMVQKDDQE